MSTLHVCTHLANFSGSTAMVGANYHPVRLPTDQKHNETRATAFEFASMPPRLLSNYFHHLTTCTHSNLHTMVVPIISHKLHISSSPNSFLQPHPPAAPVRNSGDTVKSICRPDSTQTNGSRKSRYPRPGRHLVRNARH